MTQKDNLDDTLPEQQVREVEMATIMCEQCGSMRQVRLQGVVHNIGEGVVKKDVMRATLTCAKCDTRNVFELVEEAVTFRPSGAMYGALSANAPEDVTDIFLEAELCFYGLAYRAAAVMCRACVEQALTVKGISKGSLEDRIDVAQRQGILDQRVYMLSHGSRLIGNDAVHIKRVVNPGDVPAVLSTAVSIVNHVFP